MTSGNRSSKCENPTERQAPAGQPSSVTQLKAKGACWYCNQPLDNVRRFCNKTCADDYRAEEETFGNVNK